MQALGPVSVTRGRHGAVLDAYRIARANVRGSLARSGNSFLNSSNGTEQIRTMLAGGVAERLGGFAHLRDYVGSSKRSGTSMLAKAERDGSLDELLPRMRQVLGDFASAAYLALLYSGLQVSRSQLGDEAELHGDRGNHQFDEAAATITAPNANGAVRRGLKTAKRPAPLR
jgi:hypothetical protein